MKDIENLFVAIVSLILVIIMILLFIFVCNNNIRKNVEKIRFIEEQEQIEILEPIANIKTYTINQSTPEIKLKALPNTNISKGDIVLLKRLIFAECGNEPIEGMAQVFFCVLNRAASGSSDFRNVNTIEDVIYQQTASADGHVMYQFSCIPTDNFTNVENIESEWFTEKWDKMIQGCNDGTYMNNGNLFYCRSYCNSWHRANLSYLETVGLHEFYKYLEE